MQKTVTLKRNLGFFSVFAIGLSLLTPSTVFTIFGIASSNTQGHVPAVYIFATLAIFFTVFSYMNMVKVFPKSGSAYTYVQQTINPSVGFLVGWGTLFDYLFLPVVYVLSLTLYVMPIFPDVPLWVWVVGTMLFISLANIFSVKVAVSFSTFLIVLQLLITGIFVYLLIRFQISNQGIEQIFSLKPFFSDSLSPSLILAGSVMLAYSFIGFDAVSTLAEETHNPRKTIPKVMIALVLFIGILYTSVTYFMQLSYPDVSIFASPDSAIVEIANQVGGMLFTSVFTGIVIAGILVGAIAAQMSTSRLLYAMGRDEVFPKKIFGYLHPRTHIPIYNILITGVVGLTSVFLTLEQASNIISFGAFTAFTFVNLCVIVHYIINEKMKSLKAILIYLICPLLGLAFLAVMWYNINKIALVLGLSWNILGFLFLIYITKAFKKPAPTLSFDESHAG
ncbi:APC family permease [Peribacillus simplex]